MMTKNWTTWSMMKMTTRINASFGRDNEEWYRCVMCGYWSHSECSGWESAEDYTCDLCMKKEKIREKKKKVGSKKNEIKKAFYIIICSILVSI